MKDHVPSPGLRQAWTLAILAHVFWGFLGPGAKLLFEWWPPWTLNAVRMGIASLALMAWFGREETRYGLKALMVDKNLVILGGVGIGLTFGLYTASLAYIEATAAAVLIFLAPYGTALMARIFLGERSGWYLGVAATVALTGAWLALFGFDVSILQDLGGPMAFGIGINLISVLMWSIYTVHLKAVEPRYPLGRLTIATFVAATVFFTANAIVFERHDWNVDMVVQPMSYVLMGLYVLFPTLGSFLCYSASIGRVGAGPITILLGVELLSTALLAHFILLERFPPTRMVGLGLAAVAVTWFVWMSMRKEMAASAP